MTRTQFESPYGEKLSFYEIKFLPFRELVVINNDDFIYNKAWRFPQYINSAQKQKLVSFVKQHEILEIRGVSYFSSPNKKIAKIADPKIRIAISCRSGHISEILMGVKPGANLIIIDDQIYSVLTWNMVFDKGNMYSVFRISNDQEGMGITYFIVKLGHANNLTIKQLIVNNIKDSILEKYMNGVEND